MFRRASARSFPAVVLAATGVLAGLCVALSQAHAEEAMTFEAVGGFSNAIAATGRITESTPGAFSAYLRDHGGQAPTVYLDSPGGTVVSAMAFGTLMRKAGATAIVGKAAAGFGESSVERGECFSACVYALMGARRRIIPAGSEVGIHKMFLAIEGQGDVTRFVAPRDRSVANGVRAALSGYASRMGVSPDLIAYAEGVSSGFHVLTPGEIRKWRLGSPN